MSSASFRGFSAVQAAAGVAPSTEAAPSTGPIAPPSMDLVVASSRQAIVVPAPAVEAPAAEVSNQPRNVTARFEDLAPEDSIYETADGYLVKVKVLWDDTPIADDAGLAYRSQHGAERFTVTGSIVGADGKTLRRDNGDHAIHDLRRGHTHHADREQDPLIGIEVGRLKCVDDVIRAEKHYQLLRGGYTPGVVSKGQQAARKAEEAAAQVVEIMGVGDAVS